MDVRGPQKAQNPALAGGGTGQPAPRGLGTGRPQCRHGPALVGRATDVLARPTLLVFHRPLGRLRGRLAALAAPALPERRRRHERGGGHQLRLAPALRRVGAQILFVQQMLTHAYRPHQNRN